MDRSNASVGDPTRGPGSVLDGHRQGPPKGNLSLTPTPLKRRRNDARFSSQRASLINTHPQSARVCSNKLHHSRDDNTHLIMQSFYAYQSMLFRCRCVCFTACGLLSQSAVWSTSLTYSGLFSLNTVDMHEIEMLYWLSPLLDPGVSVICEKAISCVYACVC